MKKIILTMVIATAVMVACTPKASKTLPPEQAPETPSAAATASSADAGGLLIASSKCTKCHEDQTGHVAKHSFAEQETLMQNMAKKAKLSEQETADLMAYVKANAKQ